MSGPLRTIGRVKPSITAIPIPDFLAHPRPRYLVKHLLPRLGIGVIYGEPGSGKTFFTLDVALHVARGVPWRGHRVARAGVIYLVAEGATGFRDRLRAHLEQLSPSERDDIAMEIIATPVDLLHPGAHLTELITAMRDASERIGKVGLIVVDTLSRTMPGGNENAPEDMTAYVSNVSNLADAVGAFAMLIHHAGKDPSRGARGHSALRAAADLEIELTVASKTEHVATVSKARDFAGGARYGFRLSRVDLGVDEDGDAITSCIVVPVTPGPKRPSGKQQLRLLDLLDREYRNGRRAWTHAEMRALGRTQLEMGKSTASAAVSGLIDGGYLISAEAGLTLSDPPIGANEQE